jgi:hypothetical protein
MDTCVSLKERVAQERHSSEYDLETDAGSMHICI